MQQNWMSQAICKEISTIIVGHFFLYKEMGAEFVQFKQLNFYVSFTNFPFHLRSGFSERKTVGDI